MATSEDSPTNLISIQKRNKNIINSKVVAQSLEQPSMKLQA